MSPAIGSPDALDRRGDQAALRPIENLLPAASPRPEKRARSAECDASDAGVKPAKARDVFRNPASGDEAQPLGREQEYQQISAAVTDFAACGLGSSMYVSGLPGTGKSHTVRKALLAAANAADQPAYSICWVNCMAAGGAAEVYGQLAACVTRGASSGVGGAGAEDAPSSSGSGRATLKQVLAALTDSTCSSSSNSSAQASGSASARLGRKRRRSSTAQAQAGQPPRIVLVLDEIDALVAKGQQDVYDLFMLPRHPGVQVLVIGIANSIDLTDRALPALKLRGCSPSLLCFPAYTAAQMSAILAAAAARVDDSVLQQSALDLCARSVSGSTGDLRHALRACRAALAAATARQQAAAQQPPQQEDPPAAKRAPSVTVTVRDMAAALAKLAGVRSTQAATMHASSMRSLPNQQQLLLFALSSLCPPPAADAAAADGGTPTASPAANLLSGPAWATPAAKDATSLPGSSSKAKKGSKAAAFTSAVRLEDLHLQYVKVCRLVGITAVQQSELRHMADLLAQMALVDITTLGGGAGGGGGAVTPGGGGLRGLKQVAKRRSSTGASTKAASSAAAGSLGYTVISMRASHEEVRCACAANPVLRSLVA